MSSGRFWIRSASGRKLRAAAVVRLRPRVGLAQRGDHLLFEGTTWLRVGRLVRDQAGAFGFGHLSQSGGNLLRRPAEEDQPIVDVLV